MYRIPNIITLSLLDQGIRPVFEDLDITEVDEDTEDYTELEDDEITPNEDEISNDEQKSNDSEVDQEDIPEEDEGSTDYTAMSDEEGDGEASDNEDETPEGEDDAGMEESDGEDEEEKSKKYFLLKDYLSLFQIIKDGLKTLSTVRTFDQNKAVVIKKVEENLEILKDYMYYYLTNEFDKNTYVENLTNYNFFSSSLSVNIKMMKQGNELTTFIQE